MRQRRESFKGMARGPYEIRRSPIRPGCVMKIREVSRHIRATVVSCVHPLSKERIVEFSERGALFQLLASDENSRLEFDGYKCRFTRRLRGKETTEVRVYIYIDLTACSFRVQWSLTTSLNYNRISKCPNKQLRATTLPSLGSMRARLSAQQRARSRPNENRSKLLYLVRN